ncbi:MAG: Dna2/Cas4 domain-containing protein, partial [Leptolyngbyaceae cyanobacterium MO_188.B28]|nr:Dna2/Cas4 domain-containing protein [Leptolyngbyaceae cyanobacterium MO_188.B28]
MKAKVTNDVLESYIHCRYKGYLKLIGQSGIKSDYEKLRFKLRREVKHHALRKIHAKADEGQIINDVSLNTSILEKSSLFILNVSVENSHFSFILDGIKKVTTKRKNSFYAPILFYEGSRIRKEQRLFLELLAILLFDYQIVIPVVGIIWHGKECKQTTVHLNTDSRKFKQTLLDLKKIYAGEEVPKLVLNNHCQICEFKAYCYEKAQQEDNLSLIRGISEK